MHPELRYLLANYFHQDWTIEGDTPEAVIDAYAASEQRASVVAARDAAGEMLARDLPEPAIAEALIDAGLVYSPVLAGSSHRAFLRLVYERLSANLAREDTPGA